MQDLNKKIVKKILLDLAKHVNVSNINGLSEYLGENKSKLYSWVNNGSIGDTGCILGKIPEINIEWIKTGKGSMLRDNYLVGGAVKQQFKAEENPAKTSTIQIDSNLQDELFEMPDMVKMTMEILASKTIYRSALASNIRAFHKSIQGEAEMAGLREEMQVMSAELQEVKQLLLSLGATMPEKRDKKAV